MLFFRAPKSLTAIKPVFGRDGRELKGRDVAIVSDWFTKKGLLKVFIKDRRSRRRLFFSRV